MKRVYQCEGCDGVWESRNLIYPCAGGCGGEICEHCVTRYAHCHQCEVGKTDDELRKAGIAAGFNFELDD